MKRVQYSHVTPVNRNVDQVKCGGIGHLYVIRNLVNHEWFVVPYTLPTGDQARTISQAKVIAPTIHWLENKDVDPLLRIIIAASAIMIPDQSPAAQALSLEFVADISYNPRTNQYRVDLVEPYRSELPHTQNFLLLDVDGFTVDKLLDAFECDVIGYYQRKWDEARGRLERVRRSLQATNKK